MRVTLPRRAWMFLTLAIAASSAHSQGASRVSIRTDLQSGSAPATFQALVHLQEMGSDGVFALDEVIDLLDSELKLGRIEVRSVAFFVISQMGPGASAAVPHMIRELTSGDPVARQGAVLALTGISPNVHAAIPALRNALENDPDVDVRRLAPFALAKLGGDGREALPSLERALLDPELAVRVAVIVAVVKIGVPSGTVMERLAAILRKTTNESPNPSAFAGYALHALGLENSDVSVQELVSILADQAEHASEHDARLIAIVTLRELGAQARAAIPALSRIRTEETGDLESQATDALEAIRE